MELSTHGRMYTAPPHLGPSTSRASRDPFATKMIGHGPRNSKMSQSTLTSQSSASLNTLSTVTTATSQGSGTVVATNNIINQKADSSRSLYQICVSLRQRLQAVPGFDEHLRDMDIEGAQEDHDVVVSLWQCLKRGYPLITIYNVLQPAEPLQVDEKISDAKKPKSAASKFVLRCLTDLKLPPEEVFVLNDLFGTDTTGFLKVTQVINTVLNIAAERGLLQEQAVEDATPAVGNGVGGKMSYRDHVVKELVDTERKYVQDLENLHELKMLIEQKGVVPGDIIHAIFLNINAILDFQRRFLIRIETTNSQPDSRQDWGSPFYQYKEGFQIYQPFIANQRRAADIAKREFDKLHTAGHPVVEDFNTLDGFLLKPMQRLVKYPLLLKVMLDAVEKEMAERPTDPYQDLKNKTNADEETKALLQQGIDAANFVLQQANDAVDRELRSEALQDLCNRVDEWKGHDVHSFGELLLHGVFTVVTGKSDVEKEVKTYTVSHPDMPMMPTSSSSTPSAGSHTSQKNQYTIYLFERILLCCKELNPNKAAKEKLLGGQKQKKEAKEKLAKDLKAGVKPTTKLQLKGRIFMTNVTDVISMVKPGSYTVQIWWKGDPGIENFVIRFTNEEVMKKWSAMVDKQRKDCIEPPMHADPNAAPPEFAWMNTQKENLQNPYAEPDDDDEDDLHLANSGVYSQQAQMQQEYSGQHTFPGQLNFGMDRTRNGSPTSLRSRSTTGESSQSLAGMVRQAPPRFPMPSAPLPLSLQTGAGHNASPGARMPIGDSYFSPVMDSPASSRTSQNSMYPFPRQTTPQGQQEWEASQQAPGQTRYTAPAQVNRAPSRESQHSINGGYGSMGARNPQRPSLPAMQSHSATQGGPRSRSFSTPDVNAQLQGQRRREQAQGVPAVPGIPPHLHPAYDHGIPRSSNNSPINAIQGQLPVRAATQSPGIQRERLQAHLGGAGGSMVPPPYLRSNTAQIPVNRHDDRSSGDHSLPTLANTQSSQGHHPHPSTSSHISHPSTDFASANASASGLPTQLKVKVNIPPGHYITLVVATNISYSSLVDRIDAKISRLTSSGEGIGSGNMRLRYRDADGDLVTVDGDEGVQEAFEEWREMNEQRENGGEGGVGEIELFCAGVDGKKLLMIEQLDNPMV